MDYAAMFFNSIMGYFDYSERTVADLIRDRIQNRRANLLQEVQDRINDSCSDQQSDASDTYFLNVIDQLKKICSMDPIKQVDSLSNLLKMIEGIDNISKHHIDAANEIINRIKCNVSLKTGFSDSTIHGYKDKIPQNKIKGLFDYFLSHEEYPPILIGSLVELIDSFSDIDSQTRLNMISTLEKGDDNNYHIYSVLRTLHQQNRLCQHPQHSPKLRSVESLLTSGKTNNDVQIYKKIMNLVEETWGNISPESLGIAQSEFNNIKSASVEDLIDDYTFHQSILQESISVFNSQSFLAILKYRLYNALYNQGIKEEVPQTNAAEDISDDTKDEYPAVMTVAMALLGKALEGSTIFIHPAANVSSPVYIGHHTMIGKQCKIGQFCILGNNVCLYPFNTLNKKRLDRYITLGRSNIIFSNTRILGTITFGDNCILNSSCITGGSFSNTVSENSGITNGCVSPLSDSQIERFRNTIINDIKTDAVKNAAAH